MHMIYRFIFKDNVLWKEITETFFLSLLSAQNIFGRTKVKLDANYEFDEANKTVEIDKTTEVGQHISQHFVSWITRSFGEEAFKVVRLRKRKKFVEDNASSRRKKSA